MLAATKDELMETILSTARFDKKYSLAKYDAIFNVAKDAAFFGHTLPSNALRICMYIKISWECQAHLDSILKELHKAVDKPKGTPDYDRISLIQSLHGVDFLGAVVLIAEMGSFDLFPYHKKLYAYFGLDPSVNNSGPSSHVQAGLSLARRILHIIAINNLKMNKETKTPINPVIYDYYMRKCANKKKIVAVGAVMHKICNIIFAMLRDNTPFKLITPKEHCERCKTEHPGSVNTAA